MENLPSDLDQINYQILLEDTVLFSRSDHNPPSLSPIEQCLTSSNHNQYDIKLLPISDNSWPAGSYLTIFGKYDNAVFKTTLTASTEESHVLSLYYGIEQNALWKMASGSVTDGWNVYSFSDSSWLDATLGSVSTTTTSGTQYFRKQFVGLANMAAYDVRLYYKAGVIAYINGAEVYRDNMPEGDVDSATVASGEYSEIAYHGFIRPILASSVAESNCFIYPDVVKVSSSVGINVANSFDFSTASFYTVAATSSCYCDIYFRGTEALH